jgi:AcrR family transcriptional regulator
MKDNKYEKILSVAGKLISQRGYKGTSLQKISDEVGLHKSSLFHYFKNKEELLLRILEHSTDEVSTELGKIIIDPTLEPEEKLKRAMDNHLTLLSENFDRVNVYLNQIGNLSKRNQKIYLRKRKKYEEDLEKIVVEMRKNGYFKGLDTKIVTLGLLGMLNWVAKWFKSNGRLPIKEVSNIFYGIVTKTTPYKEKQYVF